MLYFKIEKIMDSKIINFRLFLVCFMGKRIKLFNCAHGKQIKSKKQKFLKVIFNYLNPPLNFIFFLYARQQILLQNNWKKN